MVLLLWMLPTRSSRKDIGDAGLGRNNVMAFEKDIVPSVDIFSPKIWILFNYRKHGRFFGQN